MKKALNPIIALTMKNGAVVSALAQMLPEDDLSYYTSPSTSPEVRDEGLMPLWGKLQPPDHALPFTYEAWCKALHEIASPCRIIFHPMDIELQGWTVKNRTKALALLEEQNAIIAHWYDSKDQSEAKPGQINAFIESLRNLYNRLPVQIKPAVCPPEMLEGRLQEMEANIKARFALNAAAITVKQASLGARR